MRRRAKGGVILVPEDGWPEATLAHAAAPLERNVDPFDDVLQTADLPDPVSFFDEDPLDGVFDPLEVVAERPVAVEVPRAIAGAQGAVVGPDVFAGRAHEASPGKPRRVVPERRQGALRAAGVLSVAAVVAGAFALSGAPQSSVRPLDSVGALVASSAGLEAATHRVRLHAATLERRRQRARARQLQARRERAARVRAWQRTAAPAAHDVALPVVAARPAPVAVSAPAAAQVPSAANHPRRSAAATEFTP